MSDGSASPVEIGVERDVEALTCEQAGALARAALKTALPANLRRSLRAHHESCASCYEAYRAEGERRAAWTGHERRDAPRPRFAPVWVPLLQRRRMLAFRFLAVCALLFGISRTVGSWDADPTCQVRWLEGPAWVGGVALGDDRVLERAWRSDVLATGPGGRLEVRLGELELVLGAETEVLVESSHAKRLRLLGGEYVARGSATLQCEAGVLRLEDAAVRVRVAHGAVELDVESGAADWTSAGGSVEVPAGRGLSARPGWAELR